MQKIKMSYSRVNTNRRINISGLHSLRNTEFLLACLGVTRFASLKQLYNTQHTGFCQNLPSVLIMDRQ